MTERLLFSLIKYCKYNGHEFLAVPVYSSTTQSLAQSDTLDKLIAKFQPTLILLTLGSNELFIPKIKAERAKYVEAILKKFKGCKFIWIGPPNWAKDTGINELILSYVGKNRFFDSRHLDLARDRDGAHPTFEAGKFWADTLARWITKRSKYKIKMTPL
jgi:lysophospholipase L1-like esterase